MIGGYFDAEWMADTRELWAQAQAGKWRLLTSIVTEREVQNAPEQVRRHFAANFNAANILDTSEEIQRLAQAYLAAGVVTPKFVDDARHVAMASVHGIRLLVSWNIKHLVNVRHEDGFNAVNLLEGWPPIVSSAQRRSSMPSPTNPEALPGFDAVAESRKWKEAVARETAGMSIAEQIAYFRRHSSVEAIRQRTSAADSTDSCVVREEPPTK